MKDSMINTLLESPFHKNDETNSMWHGCLCARRALAEVYETEQLKILLFNKPITREVNTRLDR